jgi:phytoene/squalene synthetase
MRMQWWREKIYDLYDRNRNGNNQRAFGQQDTVLLRALNHAIHEHNLTRRWFERLIEARVSFSGIDYPSRRF